MSKNLYNISAVVTSSEVSENFFELTSIESSSNFVPSQALISALENSSPNIKALFDRVIGLSPLSSAVIEFATKD